MSELNGILLAIELATRKRDELAKGVVKVQRSLGFAQDQLAQLVGYAGDTDARWEGSAARAVTTELMRHHYQFMGRLQQAIAMQGAAITQINEQLEQARQTLLQAEFRLVGLSQVLKSRQLVLQRGRARSEQKQTDEFAALLHARTRAKLLMEKQHDN